MLWPLYHKQHSVSLTSCIYRFSIIFIFWRNGQQNWNRYAQILTENFTLFGNSGPNFKRYFHQLKSWKFWWLIWAWKFQFWNPCLAKIRIDRRWNFDELGSKNYRKILLNHVYLLFVDDVSVLSTTFDGTNFVGPVCGCRYTLLFTSVRFFACITLVGWLTTLFGRLTWFTMGLGISVRLEFVVAVFSLNTWQ